MNYRKEYLNDMILTTNLQKALNSKPTKKPMETILTTLPATVFISELNEF